MPELPEVETIVRRLRPIVTGRRVSRVEIIKDTVLRDHAETFVEGVTGSSVLRVERRAKFIVFRLDSDRVWLSHLRMSGHWQFVGPDGGDDQGALPAYSRAVFHLDDGSRLVYVDVRMLGQMELVSGDRWRQRERAIGPEPLAPDFSPQLLLELMSPSRRRIKEFLLDQTRVAGLGNIYVVEVLWRARVSPRRRARNVGPVRGERLHRAIVEVLGEAIEGQGTSLGATYLNFVGMDGDPGEFYSRLNVYDREGEPCRRCGTSIRRIVQAQRSTYYCPGCQR